MCRIVYKCSYGLFYSFDGVLPILNNVSYILLDDYQFSIFLMLNTCFVCSFFQDGNTPLMWASKYDVATLLIEKGADINHQNKELNTCRTFIRNTLPYPI
eukprot:GHVR01087971.1.p1 GENE.GHVR01087971.1~~GHVR01087971.1.p1  ORF type:complete len:100 (+),score=3.07 GHVR01087971.1:91-390(+)